MKPLQPGDRVRYPMPSGRKRRGIVQDFLQMQTKGEEMLYPVRPEWRRVKTRMEGNFSAIKLFKRSELRKLPPKLEGNQ